MADIDSQLRQWSATASNNKPTGATPIGTGLDDNLRVLQSVVRQYLASPGSTMSSAATVDLSTADGRSIPISGSSTVTGLGTEVAGIEYILTTLGTQTWKHSSALSLPGAADITTGSGDYMLAQSKGSGNWVIPWFTKASLSPYQPFSDATALVRSSVSATNTLRISATAMTSARVWTAFDRDGFIQISEDAWLYNATLSASVGSSALTVALKTKAGNDPSASDPVYIGFRNATAGTGDYTVLKITAATSVVASSGSTLGTVSGQASRIYITAFNDASTLRLGLYNPWDNTNKSLLGIDEGLYSSTAEGGAGAADSAQVIYTGTAVTSKAMTVLGYVESTQATAGTWATTPSKVQLLRPGSLRTGMVVQSQYKSDGAFNSGTTTIPLDDTIPQITEGNEYITASITPTSAINLLDITASLMLSAASANLGVISLALFQDATANALTAMFAKEVDASPQLAGAFRIEHVMVAATTSSTTFRARAGGTNTNGVNFNGQGAGRLFGGVSNSYMRVREVFV